MLPAFIPLKETGYLSRDSHDQKYGGVLRLDTQLCLVPALHQPPFLFPIPRAETSGSAKAGGCSCCTVSISELTLQTAAEEAVFLTLGEPRLLWRCFALDEALQAPKRPPARQDWAGRHVRQRREAEEKGAHFLQALFRRKWHFYKRC